MGQKLNGEAQHNGIGGCAKNLMKSVVSRDSVDKKVQVVYFYLVENCCIVTIERKNIHVR
jgi:hypothetical protein